MAGPGSPFLSPHAPAGMVAETCVSYSSSTMASLELWESESDPGSGSMSRLWPTLPGLDTQSSSLLTAYAVPKSRTSPCPGFLSCKTGFDLPSISKLPCSAHQRLGGLWRRQAIILSKELLSELRRLLTGTQCQRLVKGSDSTAGKRIQEATSGHQPHSWGRKPGHLPPYLGLWKLLLLPTTRCKVGLK
ncbi:hypothetical protein Cadr_000002596 [Camelus dromedarius]|uniref:Uncharacterized protein n=1 Tax=Camelus dromedarius TaxID=9838 RepID=A0A5N4C140_CAMDR|nr:hypothetical protein Cadr_000002596 [Camelus dromedarius]